MRTILITIILQMNIKLLNSLIGLLPVLQAVNFQKWNTWVLPIQQGVEIQITPRRSPSKQWKKIGLSKRGTASLSIFVFHRDVEVCSTQRKLSFKSTYLYFFLSGSNRSIGQVLHHLCLFCHLDESGSQLRSVHGPIPFPFHGKLRSVIRVKLQ